MALFIRSSLSLLLLLLLLLLLRLLGLRFDNVPHCILGVPRAVCV
jgi:hypothetical protein